MTAEIAAESVDESEFWADTVFEVGGIIAVDTGPTAGVEVVEERSSSIKNELELDESVVASCPRDSEMIVEEISDDDEDHGWELIVDRTTVLLMVEILILEIDSESPRNVELALIELIKTKDPEFVLGYEGAM